MSKNRNFALVAPYAAWMVVMSALPSTAGAYAVRGAVTAALLFVGWLMCRPAIRLTRSGLAAGVASGLVVFGVWIVPGSLLPPQPQSPYDPAVCGWALTVAKLVCSAFVISVAEELFFRKWLVDFAGFWWMVLLFAVEHGRWDAGVGAGLAFVAEGAIAGIAYGILAKRYGLVSAIVAHAITNLVLGVWIITRGVWQFW